MILSDVRNYIEGYYQENGFTKARTFTLHVLDMSNGNTTGITAEVTRVPLVEMLDMAITIEKWPTVMNGETITVGVTLLATFHGSDPNYNVNVVQIWEAKSSESYNEDDIAEKLKNEWNNTTN